MAQTRYVDAKKMACVFLVALTTEHNETLDAEKHMVQVCQLRQVSTRIMWQS